MNAYLHMLKHGGWNGRALVLAPVALWVGKLAIYSAIAYYIIREAVK